MINIIALICALILSSVSAWYSIIGLTAIFSASFWPIIVMGSVLEVSKVVTASWLYRNWSIAPRMIKYYLTAAVCVLMLITSMGIFGFLSKAHIEQQLQLTTGNADQIIIVEQKIENERQKTKDIEVQISQIDNAIQKLTEKGQAKNSLQAAQQQRKTRDSLVEQKDQQLQKISDLSIELVKLKSEVKKLEAEVGPLKYIAELVYSNADANQLEKAVRWVIILIVLVFDPLAVLLLIAANIGLTRKSKPDIMQFDFDDDTISIDKNSIIQL